MSEEKIGNVTFHGGAADGEGTISTTDVSTWTEEDGKESRTNRTTEKEVH